MRFPNIACYCIATFLASSTNAERHHRTLGAYVSVPNLAGFRGQCDPTQFFSLDREMFPEMQGVSRSASTQLQDLDTGVVPTPEFNGMGESVFNVNLGQPQAGLQRHTRMQMISWTREITNVILAESSAGLRKAYLFCDSTVMELKQPGDLVPEENGQTVAQKFEQEYGDRIDDYWYIYLGPVRSLARTAIQNKGTWAVLSKRKWPAAYDGLPFPRLDPHDPNSEHTFCAGQNPRGLTLTRELQHDRSRFAPAVIILCPQLFLPEASKTIPQGPHAIGTSLDALMPTWAVLLQQFYVWHFHARNEKVRQLRQGRSANQRLTKDDFVKSERVKVHNAEQCMALALFDKAYPPATSLKDSFVAETAMSYVVFSLGVYLQEQTRADYSTGKKRPLPDDQTEGQPPQQPPPPPYPAQDPGDRSRYHEPPSRGRPLVPSQPQNEDDCDPVPPPAQYQYSPEPPSYPPRYLPQPWGQPPHQPPQRAAQPYYPPSQPGPQPGYAQPQPAAHPNYPPSQFREMQWGPPPPPPPPGSDPYYIPPQNWDQPQNQAPPAPVHAPFREPEPPNPFAGPLRPRPQDPHGRGRRA